MKKRRIVRRIVAIAMTFIMGITMIGCSKKTDYSGEYNYETDAQYSYITNVDSWKKYQSDGNGQYILMNNYIYYYNNKTKQMTPLCDKANCLHDMETDEKRIKDCNAYIYNSRETDAELNDPGNKFIQYYEGYIYYTVGASVYRVSKDGELKEKIFTTEDNQTIMNWLFHRGKLYYEVEEHSYEGDKIYSKGILRQIDAGSSMKAKNAKIIFETDKNFNMDNFGQIRAYKNNVVFSTLCFSKDFKMTDNESWIKAANSNHYIYDTETNKVSVIDVPDKQSDTDNISSVFFLKDKMLIKKYDDMQDMEFKTTIYSMDYDTKEMRVWLEGVAQGAWIMTYDDYAIIDDSDLQYFNYHNSNSCNVEIYSSDAKKVSYFEYELNSIGTFSGFGPDGVSVDVTKDDNTWYVNEIKFEDVLKCNGEKVKPEIVSERKFGSLNNMDW